MKRQAFIALERAVMAIRFNEAIIGMQFHPEADSDSLICIYCVTTRENDHRQTR